MSDVFQTISPVDLSVYAERTYADDARMDKVLGAAQTVQVYWQNTDIKKRIEICQKAVNYFVDNADEIAHELSMQMGRPIAYSPYEITGGFKERAEYMMSRAVDALADLRMEGKPGFNRYIRKVPLGTVLVLAPWNYPYLTSVNAIIPAIIAGNCVILKHATQTPLCAERYQEAFDHAGLPEGVFQYMHLDHDQVAKVISDSRIDFVAFTGSVAGGRAVQKALQSRFINAGLELGGKDPAYVREDTDIPFAVTNVVEGALFNSGQSCCGIERVYVHQNIYDDFVAAAEAEVYKYRLGSPLDKSTTLGPVVRIPAAEFIRQQISDAINQGARNIIDPNSFHADQYGPQYLAPAVLIDVDHSMSVMQEETFGPVMGIMSVRDDEEAVRMMNDSEFGLTASIWTNDEKAATVIGDQLVTGTVFMNRCDYLDPALAWTGVKNSGRGCTLSEMGYAALTRPKSYHLRTRIR